MDINKTIEKALEPFGFSFGTLQDLGIFLRHLKKNHLLVADFLSYVDFQKQEAAGREKRVAVLREQRQKEWAEIARKCPECSAPMNLFQVNTGPRDQTGDDSNSQWVCPMCFHEECSTKTVRELLS